MAGIINLITLKSKSTYRDTNSRIPMINPMVDPTPNPDCIILMKQGTIISSVHHPGKKRLKFQPNRTFPANPRPIIIKNNPHKVLVSFFLIKTSHNYIQFEIFTFSSYFNFPILAISIE